MALPRPRSIFDAAPPPAAVSTGVAIAFPESYRKVLGIAVHGRPNGPHQLIMRGVGDQENEAIVDAATTLSRQMMNWLKKNTLIAVQGDVIYGFGDAPLASIGKGLAEFDPIDINGNVVMGRIEERRNPRVRGQGDPLFVYRKLIFLQRPGTNPMEISPVTLSRGWL